MSIKDAILKNMSMEQLLGAFEATEHVTDKDISIVRGWLMDEIEKRNPEGFDRWLNQEAPKDADLRKYVM